MMLHEDKFELLVHQHHPKNELSQLPFFYENLTYSISNGNSLYPNDILRDLGITVSSDLSWRAHIATIAACARSVASWIFSVFKTRDHYTMLTLYKSLVRSHLEYCCPIWNPHCIAEIQLIESVQRTFTDKIWGMQHLDYWGRLKALGLMSLQRRRERYIIIQMWKILHVQTPNDLKVQFYATSRNGIKAKVPKLNTNSRQYHRSMYDNSFSVLGPRLWNTLPRHLPDIKNLETFKHNLTQFLLSFPDTPPVTGYTGSNNNSILNWCMNRAESYNTESLQGWSQNVMAQ